MDVMSLYTNIPQEEGINIVCNAYEPIPQKRTSYPYTTAAKSAQTYPWRSPSFLSSVVLSRLLRTTVFSRFNAGAFI